MNASGHKMHDALDIGEQNKPEHGKTLCLANFCQQKYKCMIIYAITLVSFIELLYLIFQNNGGDSSNRIIEWMSKFVNRTNNIMK